MDRVSMRVSTRVDVGDSSEGIPGSHTVESFIRRDGDRLDVAQRMLFREVSKETGGRSFRWRAVTTKDIGVMYYAGVDMVGPPDKGIVGKRNWARWFNIRGMNEHTGGPLDGYVPASGTLRIAELMAAADSLRVLGEESVGGTTCRVVEAKTRWGIYRMWIAEALGCIPCKVSFNMGPDDCYEYGDERRLSEHTILSRDRQKRIPGARITGLLDEVAVARIGDAFVAVAGRFSLTQWYGDQASFAVYSYTRTGIDLTPHFGGTDAFVIDLPEGALVVNEDDRTSGVSYEWRGGKVVPAGATLRGEPAVSAAGEAALVPAFLWGAAGCALFGVGFGMTRWAKG